MTPLKTIQNSETLLGEQRKSQFLKYIDFTGILINNISTGNKSKMYTAIANSQKGRPGG